MMNRLTTGKLLGFTILRVMIGWHFLYEGLVKAFDPAWTSKEFLLYSVGPFSPVFQFLGKNGSLLQVVDILNIAGLVLIGFLLFVGLFNRVALIPGIILLLLYYLAYPPFIGLPVPPQLDGHYLIINNHLIEAAALYILHLFPTSHLTGLAGLSGSRLIR